MGPYLILLIILAVWTLVALWQEPDLRLYAIIYVINIFVANGAEGTTSILLDLYTFGGWPGYLLVTLGIEPLLGVLYAHYSERSPFLTALIAAIILGGPVEWLFLSSGVYQYQRGWHPALTVLCFTFYFLWTRWLKTTLSDTERLRAAH